MLVGCRTTAEFRGSRDDVFDAATSSVPRAVGGMRLIASDREAGTFEGVLVDGFGNVYLRGGVRAPADAQDGVTLIDVNCWEWSLRTLFLFPVDAPWAERRFREAVAEHLSEAAVTTAPSRERG